MLEANLESSKKKKLYVFPEIRETNVVVSRQILQGSDEQNLIPENGTW